MARRTEVERFREKALEWWKKDASPEAWLVALDALQSTTDQLAKDDKFRVVKPFMGSLLALSIANRYDDRTLNADSITKELWRWQDRLDWYFEAATEADDLGLSQQVGAEAILKTVSRPMIAGHHEEAEIPIDLLETGYPRGFDFTLQHRPDIVSVVILARMLKTKLQFDERVWDLTNLWRDLAESAKDVAEKAGDVAGDLVVEVAIPAAFVVGTIGLGLWALSKD